MVAKTKPSNTPTISTKPVRVRDRLLAFHATAWQGGRLADVTGTQPPDPPCDVDGKPLPLLANVVVRLDLVQDASLIRSAVASTGRQGCGTPYDRHYAGLRVYEPQTPEQRAVIRSMEPTQLDLGVSVWVEWGPP